MMRHFQSIYPRYKHKAPDMDVETEHVLQLTSIYHVMVLMGILDKEQWPKGTGGNSNFWGEYDESVMMEWKQLVFYVLGDVFEFFITLVLC